MAGFVAAPFMRRAYLAHTRKTTYEVLRGITDNAKLIGVLTGQYADYGLPPKRSAFAMHASVAKHYFFGGNYPVGGSARLGSVRRDDRAQDRGRRRDAADQRWGRGDRD